VALLRALRVRDRLTAKQLRNHLAALSRAVEVVYVCDELGHQAEIAGDDRISVRAR